jgi:hypothetical protein
MSTPAAGNAPRQKSSTALLTFLGLLIGVISVWTCYYDWSTDSTFVELVKVLENAEGIQAQLNPFIVEMSGEKIQHQYADWKKLAEDTVKKDEGVDIDVTAIHSVRVYSRDGKAITGRLIIYDATEKPATGKIVGPKREKKSVRNMEKVSVQESRKWAREMIDTYTLTQPLTKKQPTPAAPTVLLPKPGP